MRLLSIAIAAGTLVLAPSLGLAGSGDVPEFDKADQNGDGTVTIEEAEQAGVSAERAKSQDIDSDNELSEVDWKFLKSGSYGDTGDGEEESG